MKDKGGDRSDKKTSKET